MKTLWYFKIKQFFQGTDMVDIINEMNDGRLVVMTVQDEASSKLGSEAKLAIEKLGKQVFNCVLSLINSILNYLAQLEVS